MGNAYAFGSILRAFVVASIVSFVNLLMTSDAVFVLATAPIAFTAVCVDTLLREITGIHR